MPRFRIFTWIILAINVLFLIWIIAGASSKPTTSCTGLSAQDCTTATQVGTTIGIGLIVGLWVAADLILGILWLITKPKTRDCPSCGNSVKRGKTECKHCGYNFAAAAGQAPPARPV